LNINILYILLLSTLFSPPFIEGTSIRPDTVLIFILVPVVFFLRPNIKFSYKVWSVILPFFLIFLGVFISVFCQILFFDLPFYNGIYNIQGYSRPMLFSLFGAYIIRSNENALIIGRLILIGGGLHGLMSILEYSNFPIVSYVIDNLYRDGRDVGSRAVGLFKNVHELAYFNLYIIIFSISLLIFGNNIFKKSLLYFSLVLSIVSLTITFSKGAFLALFSIIIYLALKSKKSRNIIIYLIFGLFLLFVLSTLIFTEFYRYLVYSSGEFYNNISFIFGYVEIEKAGSIGGRLNHGWFNAINAWKQNPMFGNLSTSLTSFIGDGGYTEALANHGLVGFFLLFLCIFYISKIKIVNEYNSNISNIVFSSFSISILIALIATGFLKPRSMELMPIMFICLIFCLNDNKK